MHGDHASPSALDGFIDDGWITEIVRPIRSGKEATVYCCRGGPAAGAPLVAAKVFRPLETRRFRNDAMYHGGRVTMARNSRVRRALESRSAFGRRVQHESWLYHEWETLRALHRAGADVPAPIAVGERALLMAFIGNEDAAAPSLHEAEVDRASASAIIDQLLANIELMLDRHVVHADLSAYNVLLENGRAVVIDFPQAVDPRLNTSAAALLERDLDNVCRWAAKRGAQRPAGRIFIDLWSRFVEGALG